jgi:hypothetical protein
MASIFAAILAILVIFLVTTALPALFSLAIAAIRLLVSMLVVRPFTAIISSGVRVRWAAILLFVVGFKFDLLAS